MFNYGCRQLHRIALPRLIFQLHSHRCSFRLDVSELFARNLCELWATVLVAISVSQCPFFIKPLVMLRSNSHTFFGLTFFTTAPGFLEFCITCTSKNYKGQGQMTVVHDMCMYWIATLCNQSKQHLTMIVDIVGANVRVNTLPHLSCRRSHWGLPHIVPPCRCRWSSPSWSRIFPENWSPIVGRVRCSQCGPQRSGRLTLQCGCLSWHTTPRCPLPPWLTLSTWLGKINQTVLAQHWWHLDRRVSKRRRIYTCQKTTSYTLKWDA